MREVLVLAGLILCATIARTQVYWDGGGGDGRWNTPTNWSTDAVPDSNSNVVLDNSGVAGNYIVMLPSGDTATRILSLLIKPAAQIITLVLPATNHALNGFIATGPGDAVVLDSGAVFRNASGAPSGAPVSVLSTNFFRINDGGRYIHNTPRSHTDFLVSRLSTAPGTENGIFEFDVPGAASYTISVSNRRYGRLILSANAAGGIKTYSASGVNRFTIHGNLEINTNAILSYGANTDTVFIQKDCIIRAGGVFNISNGANSSVVWLQGHLVVAGVITESGTSANSKIWLKGTGAQSISVNGSIANHIDIDLDNPAGAFLLSPLSLPYRLTITAGNLILGDQDLLTPVINQAGVATASGNHIVTNGTGSLRMSMVNNQVFPVGPDVSHYNPVHVVNGANATYAIRVQTGITPAIANPFPAVVNRTWTINTSLSPGNAAVLKFGFYPGDGVNGFNPASPVDLGRWTNGGWSVARAGLSVVNTGSDPAYEVSVNDIAAYNSSFLIGNRSFGLATDVRIICDANRNSSMTTLRWRINEVADVIHFELQRAGPDTLFQNIAVIPGIRGKMEYSYNDPPANNSSYLYRVKAILKSGGTSYSNIVGGSSFSTETVLYQAIPNPFTSKTTVQVKASKSKTIEIRLINMTGSVIRRWKVYVFKGENNIGLPMSDIPRGLFLLESPGAVNSIRLVKQ